MITIVPLYVLRLVWDNSKLLGYIGEVPIVKWSGGGSIPALKSSLNLMESNQVGR